MNPNFIYCVDENVKNELILKGYKLIKEESMQTKKAWAFLFSPQIAFDVKDNTKYFLSNRLNF